MRKNPRNLNENQILKYLINHPDIKSFHQLGEGVEATTYYIKLIKNTHIFNKLFNPGEYVVKIYKIRTENNFLTYEQQKYLLLLSKYGVIPKIFYIDSNVLIMKYIRGITIDVFVQDVINYDPNMIKILEKQYEKLIDIWYKLGLEHGDIDPDNWLHSENILVTMKNSKIKLYFIDPALY